MDFQSFIDAAMHAAAIVIGGVAGLVVVNLPLYLYYKYVEKK